MDNIDQFGRLIETFSPSQPFNLTVAGISFAIGYIQYFYAIQLVVREKKGPLPFWTHCFYLAHDSSWSYLTGSAAPLYGNHWLLRGISTALFVWSTLELFCIYKAFTAEKEEVFDRLFGGKATLKQMIMYWVLLQATMYAVVWMFIGYVSKDRWDGIFQWFAYTNVLIIMGPANLWLERGCRDGLSMGLAITNVFCAIFTFAPFSMWAVALPEVFDNKVHYSTGVVMFLYSLYMCWILRRYPAKQVSKPGEKPIW